MERCDFMPLTAELASLPFCCGETEGDKDLEDFFHHNALLYAQERLGKTYCFVNNEGEFSEIVAFFTVSNDSVICHRGIRKSRTAFSGNFSGLYQAHVLGFIAYSDIGMSYGLDYCYWYFLSSFINISIIENEYV